MKLEKEVLSVTLTPKATSWFGTSSPKKMNLSGDADELLEWMSYLSKYAV